MAKNEALYAFVYVFVQCAVMMVSPGTLCFCGSGFTQTDVFLQRMALMVLRKFCGVLCLFNCVTRVRAFKSSGGQW